MATEEQRVFLGWDRPLPHLAVERLFSLIGDPGPADFGAYRILVPTAEAGRLLREAAAAHAGSGGIVGLEILMPDQLTRPADAPSPATVLAAWCRLLKQRDAAQVEALFDRNFAAIGNDAAMLLNAAHLLQDCRRNLAEDGCTPAAAAVRFRAAGQIGQAERFECLAELEKDLLRHLPDEPVAAMLRQTPPEDDRRTVIVLHCPDLRGAAAKFLDRWPGRVEYWIHAPGSMRDRFDRQGRALNVWREEPFEVDPDRQIRIAARTADQVGVLEDLRKRGLPVRAFGVLSGEVADAWQDRLRQSPDREMPVFFPETRPLSGMPWTLAFLRLLALRGENPTCAEIAALLHHGFFADRAVLTGFDKLQKDTVAQDLAALLKAADNTRSPVKNMLFRIRDWRESIRKAKTGHLSVVWDILRSVGEKLPKERINVRTAGTELAELEKIVTAAEHAAPDDAALTEAIARHLIRTAEIRPVPTGEEKLDAVGFLELAWYGDPLVIVAGFSEDAMGYAGLSDPFLPEQAKALLGLRTTAACQAADAFRFTALQHSAEMRYLVARTSARGDVLRPPALLMQCAENELPRRLKLLFSAQSDLMLPRHFSPDPTQKLIPRRTEPDRRKLSVTDFAAYMNCPFTFYLQKILHAEKADDRSVELDPAQTGILLHRTIAECTGLMKTAADENALSAAAKGFFKKLTDRYGTPSPGLLGAQFRIMEPSLEYFAKAQAAWQKDGWRVIRTEKDPDETALRCSWAEFHRKVFPDEPHEEWRASIEFEGRFDRLDARELADGTRELCVIDYKTGKEESPEKKHLGSAAGLSGEEQQYRNAGTKFWHDLQLPLYILMIRHLLPEERADRIRAAYFNLPTAYASTGIVEFKDLDEPLLASAMHCADEIARRIYGPNPVFWPPRKFNTLFSPYSATAEEDYETGDFCKAAVK